MQLKHPRFNLSEFNCLDSSLRVVDFWLVVNEIEKELEKLREEYDRRKVASRISAEGIKNLLLEKCSEAESLEDQKLLGNLERSCETLRNLYIRPNSEFIRRRETASIVRTVRNLFMEFNRDTLEDALDAIFHKEDSEQVESAEALQGRLVELSKDIDALWQNCDECFRSAVIPETFRGVRFGGDNARVSIGRLIINTFISSWRERAQQYRTPVTIYGVQISSLPPALRERWKAAYDKLGLGDLPKSVRYQEQKYIGDGSATVDAFVSNLSSQGDAE